MIIHTHLLVKLTGPKYSEHSRPKTGQEEWSFCTNYSTIFISVTQYIASNMHFPNIFFIYIY